MSDLIKTVNEVHLNENVAKLPNFKSGDVIAVHAKITEGDKTRIQVFQGTVIATKRKGDINGHFRVRKMSSGIGVERVFPYHCPNIDSVKIITRGKVKRSKLYYLRDRSGKSARIAVDYARKD